MQTKLTKSIQMILVTLSIMIISIISILPSNNVIASSICTGSHELRAVDFIKTEIYMSHTTYYVCIKCDYKTKKTESCKLGNFKKTSDEKHEGECQDCHDVYELSHEDNNNNGICDECFATNPTINNPTNNHICLNNSREKMEKYDKNYHIYYEICTICNNQIPGSRRREQHNFGQFTSKGSTGHSTTCKVCKYELLVEHEGASHENEGKCTVKGCEYQYETHEKSTTLTGNYTDITETTHTPIYKCSHGGCYETFTGDVENHNYQNSICVCGAKKMEEEKEEEKEEIQEEVAKEIEIKSEKYKVDDTYITNIQPQSTVNEIKANIETNGTYINIYNQGNQVVTHSKIATGMKLVIKTGDQTKSFTIIVNGDVNGDGDADFKDILKINQARLNILKLDNISSLAADITSDEKVDIKDILEINKYRLNKSTEL